MRGWIAFVAFIDVGMAVQCYLDADSFLGSQLYTAGDIAEHESRVCGFQPLSWREGRVPSPLHQHIYYRAEKEEDPSLFYHREYCTPRIKTFRVHYIILCLIKHPVVRENLVVKYSEITKSIWNMIQQKKVHDDIQEDIK
ncbi:uncharacterized protein LOC125044921 [Penaeus chinensis]|uniref:uncharacterized protein LOC125044921 n=1 Tax=Penaeus chinensis TaxID=139456 RepID=UPI001FB7C162|nr:uncharacterized protein LOC125044921 [Penaeus chinensis]